MKGWISIHRSIKEHWLYPKGRPLSKYEAWISILLEVNHTDKKEIKGFNLIECKRGESLKSLETWARLFNWNKSKVRRFFILLQNDNMIVTKNVQKTTHLTVCNYDNYQDNRNDNETMMKQTCNDNETNLTPNNNVNNVNNVNKSNSGEKMKRTKRKIISSGNKKPTTKERSKTYLPIAKRLSKIISLDKNITHSKQQLNGWANDIRLLCETNKISTKRMKIVLRWYKTNIGAQYTPVVESGFSFRKKFIQLEAAIERDKNGSTQNKSKRKGVSRNQTKDRIDYSHVN